MGDKARGKRNGERWTADTHVYTCIRTERTRRSEDFRFLTRSQDKSAPSPKLTVQGQAGRCRPLVVDCHLWFDRSRLTVRERKKEKRIGLFSSAVGNRF